MSERYSVTRLDELEPEEGADEARWFRLRRELDLGAFGVNAYGADSGQEHTFSVNPSVSFIAGTDKHRARRAQREQLVRIHRHLVPGQRPGVFEIVAGHPVVFARSGDVLHQFAIVAAVQLDVVGVSA